MSVACGTLGAMSASPFGVGDSDQQIPAHLAEVGPGWHPLLMRLHDRLVAVAPDYRVEEFTPRLGGLRIYLADRFQAEDGEFDGAWADIAGQPVEATEVEAEQTCERCGQPGRIRFHGDRHGIAHMRALCDRCHTTRVLTWADAPPAPQPASDVFR